MGDTPPDPRAAAHGSIGAPAAARLSRAARAAQELCTTLWEAIDEELRQPPVGRRVGELSEHLAQVCSVIAALAAGESLPLADEPSLAEKPSPGGEPSLAGEPSPGGEPSPRGAPSLAGEPSLTREPSLTEQASLAGEPSLAERPSLLVPAQAPEIAIHDIRGEGSGAPSGGVSSAWIEPGGESPYVGVHDPVAYSPRTAGEGPVAWAEAIEASIGRYVVDGLPFAVLLVEVLDVERLARAEPAATLARLLEAVERAIGPELRRSDTVVCESHGRCWLTASRVDAVGARKLAERLARSVRTAVGHRGVPLDLAIGVAVCPDDGRDVATLAARADVGLYAARAAGRPVAPVDDAP